MGNPLLNQIRASFCGNERPQKNKVLYDVTSDNTINKSRKVNNEMYVIKIIQCSTAMESDRSIQKNSILLQIS